MDKEEGYQEEEGVACILVFLYMHVSKGVSQMLSHQSGITKIEPKMSHLAQVKEILKYVNDTSDYGILYTHGENSMLIGYYDAVWEGCADDRKSTSGACFFLANYLISWFSKKQNCVSLSTTEAEYIVAGSSCPQLLWMKQMLLEHNVLQDAIYFDNRSAIHISKNPIQHSRTNHIDIKHHFIRDLVDEGTVTLEHTAIEEQLAWMQPNLKHCKANLRMFLVVRKYSSEDGMLCSPLLCSTNSKVGDGKEEDVTPMLEHVQKSVPEQDAAHNAATSATTSATPVDFNNFVVTDSPEKVIALEGEKGHETTSHDNVLVPDKEKVPEVTAIDNVFIHDTDVISQSNESIKNVSEHLEDKGENPAEETPAEPKKKSLKRKEVSFSDSDFDEEQHVIASSGTSLIKSIRVLIVSDVVVNDTPDIDPVSAVVTNDNPSGGNQKIIDVENFQPSNTPVRKLPTSMTRRLRSSASKEHVASGTPAKTPQKKTPIEYEVDHDAAASLAASSKRSGKKTKIPQAMSSIPIDNISFHLAGNASRWEFVIKRRLAIERNLSEDFLACQKLHPGIYTESNVPATRPSALTMDFRLLEGSHAADIAVASVRQPTCVMSRKQMMADLKEVSKSLGEKKNMVDRVIQYLELAPGAREESSHSSLCVPDDANAGGETEVEEGDSHSSPSMFSMLSDTLWYPVILCRFAPDIWY
ncbi:retrovirus-related Pol polyprotein from transposon TNT 1-94 [Trifolium pratense]|uniref:Retrovirus-related Pol polyprotein from transposon TNT 1-94 n=1 Tax=Trifolium pratense TaxID=57577 RepID=A0A2K3PEK8_TRIPR|nr:retrovirus-related Pol polyprotein from transposon TNT 1-94 [Trifolium pratense]